MHRLTHACLKSFYSPWLPTGFPSDFLARPMRSVTPTSASFSFLSPSTLSHKHDGHSILNIRCSWMSSSLCMCYSPCLQGLSPAFCPAELFFIFEDPQLKYDLVTEHFLIPSGRAIRIGFIIEIWLYTIVEASWWNRLWEVVTSAFRAGSWKGKEGKNKLEPELGLWGWFWTCVGFSPPWGLQIWCCRCLL